MNPDDVHEANQTTPFVDQNQTYTSHPSHQVFLREYKPNAAAKPVQRRQRAADGSRDGMGNWAEVKAQARDLLGIRLTDLDVLNVPLLATDPYGHFIPGANGFPQVVTSGQRCVEGNPATPGPDHPAAVATGHAFLDDIAHTPHPRARRDPRRPTRDTAVATSRSARHLRRRAARSALHRRRRAGQREHRPDRCAPPCSTPSTTGWSGRSRRR